MKTSAKGRQFIAAMEGTVLHVYLDSAGLPTAGVGHLLTVAERNVYRVNQSVTKAECDAWLAKDLKEAEGAVYSSVTVKITQNQFDALVSLAFNIGTGAFSRSVVVKKCNAADNVGSANAFQSWNKATVNGKKMIIEGLVKRRNKERRLFLTPDSAAVPVAPQPIPRPDTQLSVSPNTAVEQPPTLNAQMSADTKTAEKSIGHLSDIAHKAQSAIDFSTSFETSVSRSSWTVTIIKLVIGFLGLTWGFVKENPVEILAGVAVIAIAAWYLTRAKDRAKGI
jgi:lysozyme